MQFQMPQFIDIEDKVIGPLTFKQFLYLGGSCGFAYIIYKFIGLGYGFIFIILFLGLGVGLAFWKPNNRSAIVMLQAFINHYTKTRMYVWQRPERKQDAIKTQTQKQTTLQNKKIDNQKLESLAWSLDVLDRQKK